MPAVLSKSSLSRSDLRLFLTNEDGYSQDAHEVLWTVYDSSGKAVSGLRLPAIKTTTGEYYAPWYSDVSQGNYEVEWRYRSDSTSEPVVTREKLYVVDPGAWPNQVTPKFVPEPGGLAYWMGTTLGRGDLPLFLRTADGYPASPFVVYWTILDARGFAAGDRTPATLAAPGEYYAPLTVNVTPGSYRVLWEFMLTADDPMESASLPFSVLGPFISGCRIPFGPPCTVTSPCAPSQSCTIIPSSVICGLVKAMSCSSFTVQSVPVVSLPPSSCCSSVEVPRTVHLSQGVLPASGVFTSQPAFPIPVGVSRITFYITYTRGAPGGYAAFRLFWGNGTEEVQETILDTDMFVAQPQGFQSLVLQDLSGPAPSDGSPVNFTLYASIPGGVKTVRLVAAERGMPVLPGSAKIVLTGTG